MQNIVNQLLA